MVYQRAEVRANALSRTRTAAPQQIGLDFILLHGGCHGGAALSLIRAALPRFKTGERGRDKTLRASPFAANRVLRVGAKTRVVFLFCLPRRGFLRQKLRRV